MADSGKNSDNKADAYRPGMYHLTMPKIYDIIASAFQEWRSEKPEAQKNLPLICISRKIGVGSYEIAEAAMREFDMVLHMDYLKNPMDFFTACKKNRHRIPKNMNGVQSIIIYPSFS